MPIHATRRSKSVAIQIQSQVQEEKLQRLSLPQLPKSQLARPLQQLPNLHLNQLQLLILMTIPIINPPPNLNQEVNKVITYQE